MKKERSVCWFPRAVNTHKGSHGACRLGVEQMMPVWRPSRPFILRALNPSFLPRAADNDDAKSETINRKITFIVTARGVSCIISAVARKVPTPPLTPRSTRPTITQLLWQVTRSEFAAYVSPSHAFCHLPLTHNLEQSAPGV